MIIDEIVKRTKEDLIRRKKEFGEEMIGRAMAMNPFFPRDIEEALKRDNQTPYKIVAEIKQSTPAKGVLRESFDPIFIANSCEAGGACALSVATEPHWFSGEVEYLSHIRRYNALPIIRSDFVIDRYQILEALFFGADSVVLIAKIVGTKELKTLIDTARSVGMEAVVAICDKSDLTKAIMAGAEIVAISHIDFANFELDLTASQRLVPLIPQGKVIVAGGGISSRKEVADLIELGVDSVMVGESLMRSESIDEKLKELLDKQ